MGFNRLTLKERKRIAQFFKKKLAQREIARRMKRDPSTICREIARNGKWMGRPTEYQMPNNRYNAEDAEKQSIVRRSKLQQAERRAKSVKAKKKAVKKKAAKNTTAMNTTAKKKTARRRARKDR